MGLDQPVYDQPKNLRDILDQLPLGARIRDLEPTPALKAAGLTVFCLDVEGFGEEDIQWQKKETATSLVPHFGELVWQAYGSKDEKRPFNPKDNAMKKKVLGDIEDGDLGAAQHVYVVAKDNKAVGFLATCDYELENDKKGCYGFLMVVERELRSQGIGSELARCMLAAENYDFLAGVTNTPGAVKMALSRSKEFGFTPFYCGLENGEMGKPGTPDQQKMVRELSAMLTEEFVEQGGTILHDKKGKGVPKATMPEGYIVLRQDYGPIPPLKREDINLGPEDATLKDTFEQVLLPVQEQHLPNTVYGIILCIKE